MDIFEQVKQALDENKRLEKEECKLRNDIYKRNGNNYNCILPKITELIKLANATEDITGVHKATTVIDDVCYEMGTSYSYVKGVYIDGKKIFDWHSNLCQTSDNFMLMSKYFGTLLDAHNTLSNICKLFEVYFDEVLERIKGSNDRLTDCIAKYKAELARSCVKEDGSIEIIVDGKSYIARPKVDGKSYIARPKEDELA